MIGIAANMLTNSPYEKIDPAIFFGGLYVSNMIIRIKPGLATSTALAYWGMYQWLSKYPYHAPMSCWIFATAGAGLLLITLMTVSFQSIKAALMNPVRSLRSE